MNQLRVSLATKSLITNIFADLTQPSRNLGYMREWVRANYRWIQYRPNLSTITLTELCAKQKLPQLTLKYQYDVMGLPPMELYALGIITQCLQPATIFEFGTYKGATTHYIARNAPKSQIFTIDFPLEHDGNVHYHGDPTHPKIFKAGEAFHDVPIDATITQLYGDTLTFDFSRFDQSFDLIFIDAEHSYECAMSDTKNALRMIKQGGLIVWDDYLEWPGVKKAVEELSAEYPIQYLDGTRFAVLRC